MLNFEKARPPQHKEAEQILRAAFAPYVRKLGRELADDAFAWLPAALDRGDIYLAVEATEVVGVMATTRRATEMTLDQIAVNPLRQGTGVGSWLLARIEEVARSEGIRVLSLDTAEMAEDNVRLYARHGFRIVRRGPPAHGKDPHLRVYMSKVLSSTPEAIGPQ
jgi:GNAT superfamily N-acetyltransferase